MQIMTLLSTSPYQFKLLQKDWSQSFEVIYIVGLNPFELPKAFGHTHSTKRLQHWDGTLAKSYQGQATTAAEKVTAVAGNKKTSKYSNIDQAYLFMPVAIETFSGGSRGALGSGTPVLLLDAVISRS